MTVHYLATAGSRSAYRGKVATITFFASVLGIAGSASMLPLLSSESDSSALWEAIRLGVIFFLVGFAGAYGRMGVHHYRPRRIEIDDEYVTLKTPFRTRRVPIDDIVRTVGGIIVTLYAADGTKLKTDAHDRPYADTPDPRDESRWDGGGYVEHFARNYDELVTALKNNRSEFAAELTVEPIPERNSGKGEVQFVMVAAAIFGFLGLLRAIEYFS